MNDLQTKANGANKVPPATDPKANAKSTTVKSETILPKLETSAEKRIKNLENFQALCSKFNFLKHKSDDLNAYLVGRDGLKETLIIENTDGKTFEMSNSRIIEKILLIAQEELYNLLDCFIQLKKSFFAWMVFISFHHRPKKEFAIYIFNHNYSGFFWQINFNRFFDWNLIFVNCFHS